MRQTMQDAIDGGVNMALLQRQQHLLPDRPGPNAAGQPLTGGSTATRARTPGSTTGRVPVPHAAAARERAQRRDAERRRHRAPVPRLRRRRSWIYAGTGLATYTGNGTTGRHERRRPERDRRASIGYEFDDARRQRPRASSSYVALRAAGRASRSGTRSCPPPTTASHAWSDAVVYTARERRDRLLGRHDPVVLASTTASTTASATATTDSRTRSASRSPPTSSTGFLAPRRRRAAVSAGADEPELRAQLVGTTSAAQDATLTNTGTAPLTISSIAVTGRERGRLRADQHLPAVPARSRPAQLLDLVTFTPGATGQPLGQLRSSTTRPAARTHPPERHRAPAPAVTLAPTTSPSGAQRRRHDERVRRPSP